MPKKTEWHWEAVEVGRTYRKTWDELGVTPEQFKIFREASHRHFTTGKKSESDRIWNLLKAGHTIRSLTALANDDIQEYSSLFGCLLELTDKKFTNSRDALKGVRSYLEHLPDCDPVEIVDWMQLLSLDELILLEDAGFIAEGLETVASALQQIQEGSKWLRAAQIKLLAELPNRFDWDEILFAVDNDRLRFLASQHVTNSYFEQKSADFASGEFGDWASLGISNDEMYDIVSIFYESSDLMEQEVASFYRDGANNGLFLDFKKLLRGSLTARELHSLIRDGLTADDITGLKEAGLSISKENIANWSYVEGKVILFCIDNGISPDDRGDQFADWMPTADVVLPWWDYCTKKGWLNKYTKAELLQGISLDDAGIDRLIQTLDGSVAVELLSLWDYVSWIHYSGLKGRFKEIEQWRTRGFGVKERTTPPNFEGSDGRSRSDAHAWRYFKFTPEQATDWYNIKLMERLMAALSPKEAAEWRDAGVKPNEVKIWFDHEIKEPSEVAAWIATGATPEVAQNRKRAGVTPNQI